MGKDRSAVGVKQCVQNSLTLLKLKLSRLLDHTEEGFHDVKGGQCNSNAYPAFIPGAPSLVECMHSVLYEAPLRGEL